MFLSLLEPSTSLENRFTFFKQSGDTFSCIFSFYGAGLAVCLHLCSTAGIPADSPVNRTLHHSNCYRSTGLNFTRQLPCLFQHIFPIKGIVGKSDFRSFPSKRVVSPGLSVSSTPLLPYRILHALPPAQLRQVLQQDAADFQHRLRMAVNAGVVGRNDQLRRYVVQPGALQRHHAVALLQKPL